MYKIPVRKILASILFILILIFTYLIYKKIGEERTHTEFIVLFGGIVFSSLFLLSIVFSKNIIVKTVYEEHKKGSEKENENKKEEVENISYKESFQFINEYNTKTNIKELSEYILINLAKKLNSVQGILYVREKNSDFFSSFAKYALYGEKKDFKEGNGINGQVAINKKLKIITDIPEDYISVVSGLGSASPNNLLVMPFVFNNKTIALIELASFKKFPEYIQEFYNHINNNIANQFNKLINEQ